jgi:hypothetical protein
LYKDYQGKGMGVSMYITWQDVKHYCAIDYTSHNVKMTRQVLPNPILYADRLEICDNPPKAFSKMEKYFYRILAHIFFYHSNLFNILEEKFKIYERLSLYCKKLKILESKEYIINN